MTKKMEKNFLLALREIELVLQGEKSVTDETHAAESTLRNYVRTKAKEIRIKSKEMRRRKLNAKNY